MTLETRSVQCPYCGETIDVGIENLNEAQRFIEDCTVCCRPIQYEVNRNDEGETDVMADRSD